MSSKLRRTLLLFTVLASLLCRDSAAQTNPSTCTTEMCRAIRRIMDMAPNRFGGPLPHGPGVHSFPITVPGFTECFSNEDGLGPVRCTRQFWEDSDAPDFSGKAHRFASEVADAIRAAAPRWCYGPINPLFPQSRYSDDSQYGVGPGDCSNHHPIYVAASLNRNKGSSKFWIDVELFVWEFDAAALASSATPPVPPTASLQIVTQPGGVQIYLDDEPRGITSPEGRLLLRNLSPATYRVRASLIGYKQWTGSVTLSAGDTGQLSPKLEATGPRPLSRSDVKEALENSVARQHIIAMVNQYGVDFSLTDDIEKELRAAGADDSVILAIMKNRK